MITGHHRHLDSGGAALGHRGAGLGAQRIDQADQSDQGQIDQVLLVEIFLFSHLDVAKGERDHAISFGSKLPGLGLDRDLVERRNTIRLQCGAAHFQQLFEGPFDECARLAFHPV